MQQIHRKSLHSGRNPDLVELDENETSFPNTLQEVQ